MDHQEDMDEYIPSQQEYKSSPDKMSEVLNQFVEPESKVSSDIVLTETKNGYLINRVPTKYLERSTKDISTSNLDAYQTKIVTAQYRLAQVIHGVGKDYNLDLSDLSNFFLERSLSYCLISKGKEFELLKEILSNETRVVSKSEKHLTQTENNAVKKKRAGWLPF